jgi:hypothetical protein
LSGKSISSLDIERPETVALLYQNVFISSTNLAVTSGHNSSKDFDNIFEITFLFKASFINHNSFGTISLN